MCVGPPTARPRRVGSIRLATKATLQPSATVSDHDGNNVLPSHFAAKRFSPKKKVQFADNTINNKISHTLIDPLMLSSADMYEVDKAKRWWDEEQLHCIRKLAQNASVEIQENEKSSNSLDPLSYSRVLKRTYKASFCKVAITNTSPRHLILEEEVNRQCLEYWVKRCHEIRGLERWSIPAIGSDRAKRKFRCIHGILKIQQELKLKPNIPDTTKLHLLRSVSEQLTLPARKFALTMGKADAAAAAAAEIVAPSFSSFSKNENQADLLVSGKVHCATTGREIYKECAIHTVSKKVKLEERVMPAQHDHQEMETVVT